MSSVSVYGSSLRRGIFERETARPESSTIARGSETRWTPVCQANRQSLTCVRKRPERGSVEPVWSEYSNEANPAGYARIRLLRPPGITPRLGGSRLALPP